MRRRSGISNILITHQYRQLEQNLLVQKNSDYNSGQGKQTNKLSPPPRFSYHPTALTEEEEWDFQYSDHTLVSPTGIFCASNDDDAWKPHEFYELISPHTQEDLLGLCCRTEQNYFTRLIIIRMKNEG